MENSNHQEDQPTNSEITNDLINQTAALKKRTEEVNEKLNELKKKTDKLLHPEEEVKKNS